MSGVHSHNRTGVVCGVAVAGFVVVGLFAIAYRFDHNTDQLEQQHQADQVRIADLEANANLVKQVKLAGQARDRQDQRTQRLLCAVFKDVLRQPPSIGIDVHGNDVSDCQDRPAVPAYPQRSRP